MIFYIYLRINYLYKVMNTYRETQPWGFTDYEIVEGTHITFETNVQTVDFITNPHFGRILFLDGVLQSTSSDEHIYHEALVNAGMNSASRNVLIAGGAEGGVAREVLKRPSVKYVKMVDWDADLVEHCFMREKFNVTAFEDKRLSYSNKNILNYCEETQRTFDTVFVDLLDIGTEDEFEKMKIILNWIYKVCCQARGPGDHRQEVKGVCTIVVNIGRDKSFAERLQRLQRLLQLSQKSEIIQIHVPSFQEPWYLLKLFTV